MHTLYDILRFTLLFLLLGAISAGVVQASERETSAFGAIAIPAPAKPAGAEECVEPVEVMRRDHMKFLDHQRDATVIDGERGSKYSLTGCMNCHNPASESGEIIRHEDPRHFCSECHAYTSVKIDCFECHADRGLETIDQSRLAWDPASLNASTLKQRLEQPSVD